MVQKVLGKSDIFKNKQQEKDADSLTLRHASSSSSGRQRRRQMNATHNEVNLKRGQKSNQIKKGGIIVHTQARKRFDIFPP